LALRTALHAAGAAGLTELLREAEKEKTDERTLARPSWAASSLKPRPMTRAGPCATVRGANAVIALRCCRYSRLFDDYWEHRRD
jgi:hypothetical protein